MRQHFRIIASTIAMVLLIAPTAGAVTFGVDDHDRHPNVGAVRIPAELGYVLCSGTLIASDILLTAAHCSSAFPYSERVSVSFDPTLPSPIILNGTLYPNPGFNQSQSDPGDIAVVVLDAQSSIPPATLPTLGLLDELAEKNGLRRQTFTSVGYGLQEAEFGGGPISFGPFGTRMFSASRFNALNKAWLRLSQNPATGDSGTCGGDSGGPNFLELENETVIAAITIRGDAICRATNVVYRLDTESARDFLCPYLGSIEYCM